MTFGSSVYRPKSVPTSPSQFTVVRVRGGSWKERGRQWGGVEGWGGKRRDVERWGR